MIAPQVLAEVKQYSSINTAPLRSLTEKVTLFGNSAGSADALLQVLDSEIGLSSNINVRGTDRASERAEAFVRTLEKLLLSPSDYSLMEVGRLCTFLTRIIQTIGTKQPLSTIPATKSIVDAGDGHNIETWSEPAGERRTVVGCRDKKTAQANGPYIVTSARAITMSENKPSTQIERLTLMAQPSPIKEGISLVTYFGQGKNARPEGEGAAITNTGIIVIGKHENGYPHGPCRQYFPDGETYTGNFFEGEHDGVGTSVAPWGERVVAQWSLGTIVSIISRTSSGGESPFEGGSARSTSSSSTSGDSKKDRNDPPQNPPHLDIGELYNTGGTKGPFNPKK
jgi:hypothetical protein